MSIDFQNYDHPVCVPDTEGSGSGGEFANFAEGAVYTDGDRAWARLIGNGDGGGAVVSELYDVFETDPVMMTFS